MATIDTHQSSDGSIIDGPPRPDCGCQSCRHEYGNPPRCSICFLPIRPDANGWAGGHNAEPVNDGRCCGDCNARVVIVARLNRLFPKT